MIYLIKNENQILFDQFIKDLIKKTKILTHNIYSFSFEDELNSFLNLSLTKSFSLEKKLIILRIENLEPNLLKKFKTNFQLLLKSQNQIVLTTKNNPFFEQFKSFVDENSIKEFNKFNRLELRTFISKQAKKEHYKISKAEINLLLSQRADDYFTFLELKKLILLANRVDRTHLLFNQNYNHYQKIFTSFIAQDLLLLKSELEYFIHNDGNFYSLIEFLIKQYLSLIIYLDDKRNFTKKQSDKQWFFVNFYNQNLESLSNKVDLKLALKQHYQLLTLKNYLLNMARINFDYKKIFATKIIQLSIAK